MDGAYFRVHHFARQAGSPFPPLAAIGARTSKIEISTGVIDMRYQNPTHMAEDARAADLITDGKLQLGTGLPVARQTAVKPVTKRQAQPSNRSSRKH